MRKLDAWVGEWTGSGWAFAGPGQRNEFIITERVQRKIGGAVLLVEGLGKSKTGGGEERVTHDALAVISYDEKGGRYRFRAHDVRGQAIDTDLKLGEGAMEWSLHNEERGVTIRFTIRIDGDQWQERGYSSRDGKTWNPFMEMTLRRTK
jgi:hypothetical protein